MSAHLHSLGVGLLGCSVWMFALWLIARATRNAGWVDFGWAVALAALAVFDAITGTGSGPQRILIGTLGGLWGLRLAALLLFDRILGHPEDGRYQALRSHFGVHADLHFLWFFQAQAVLAVLLSWPFVVVAHDPATTLHPLQFAGIALFLIAKLGETVADLQLSAWRRNPANRGRTCRRGLWRWCRHPNYFCEWLIWCAFALCATSSPHGLWAWLCPLLMFVFVTRITGIPFAEAQALRSRGDDYRAYQRTTNAFFPGPPRRCPATTS